MQGDEHTMTDKQDTWQWQEPGTAWRGIGIYHITLTVTDRQPVLGTLVIPENDPKQARVEWSDLGRKVLGHMLDLPKRRPEIHKKCPLRPGKRRRGPGARISSRCSIRNEREPFCSSVF